MMRMSSAPMRLDEGVHRLLELQQNGHDPADEHGHAGVTEHEIGAHAVHDHGGDLGGEAGLDETAPHFRQIGDEQQHGHAQGPGGHQPAPIGDAQQGHDRAQQRDKRERANAGDLRLGVFVVAGRPTGRARATCRST